MKVLDRLQLLWAVENIVRSEEDRTSLFAQIKQHYVPNQGACDSRLTPLTKGTEFQRDLRFTYEFNVWRLRIPIPQKCSQIFRLDLGKVPDIKTWKNIFNLSTQTSAKRLICQDIFQF